MIDLAALDVPVVSPLPAFGARPRRWLKYPTARKVWLDTWPGSAAAQRKATSAALHADLSAAWESQWARWASWSVWTAWGDLPCEGLAVVLPQTGSADGGRIDWSVVRQEALRAPGFGDPEWLDQWLTEQTRAWVQALPWPSDAVPMMPEGMYLRGLPDPRAWRIEGMGMLGWVDAHGACWRLLGASRLLTVLGQAMQTATQPVAKRSPVRHAAALADLPCQVALSLPAPVLSGAQFKRLVIGSVVRLPTGLTGGGLQTLTRLRSADPYGNVDFNAAVDLRVCFGELADAVELRWRGFMKPDSENWNADKPLADDALPIEDAVVVQISCVLASGKFTLAELGQMKTGDLLPMCELPLPHLTLMVGGRQVGTGELVRCADSLAVQIINWSMDGDQQT